MSDEYSTGEQLVRTGYKLPPGTFRRVLTHPALSAVAVKLWFYLWDRSDKEGRAWPSLFTICRDSHLDRHRVVFWRRKLVQLGFLAGQNPKRNVKTGLFEVFCVRVLAGNSTECAKTHAVETHAVETHAVKAHHIRLGDNRLKGKPSSEHLTDEQLTQFASSKRLQPDLPKKNGKLNLHSEAVFLEELRGIIGDHQSRHWGGTWRLRFRANPGKCRRLLAALLSDQKENKNVERWGGYANDLWKRFAD